MARLNEPPAAPASSTVQPGVESVDARKSSQTLELVSDSNMRTKSKVVFQKPPADFEEVKRRFIRQNRDLAKNNSNQSLRIRSLELEVSRLLADNLELREQVLQLQNELDLQTPAAAIFRVKEELQAKIAELSGLVTGIEVQQDGSRREGRERRRMEGQWRERQPLTEIMRENQMPTITEDKSYPRRTLGADKIQAIRLSDHSSNESPDIGPPPVAHFEYEDPTKQMSPSVNRTSPKGTEDEELPASLTVNLETRRKRKDGQPKLEIRRHTILPPPSAKADSEASAILRTGAKRKLADRDTEKPIKPPSKDDFTFSRRSVSSETKPSAAPIKLDDGEKLPMESASPARPARKVLGDKSVNMSPRKLPTTGGKPGKGDEEKAAPLKPGQTRSRRVSAIPMPSPPDEVVPTVEIAPPMDADPVELAPKTPAPPDLFSPTPSEPSARPAESRDDTPPPSDLSTLSTASTDGAARPSRRARSAVNYAEPSLVAKMRRPGKQMVDALSGLQDPRRVMSTSTERKTSRTVVVKEEPEDDDAWKSLPAASAEPGSPLQDRTNGDGSDLARPAGGAQQAPSPQANPEHSAASATISSLIAVSKRRPTPTSQTPDSDLDATTQKMKEIDLYEFKDSSSPRTDAEAADKSAVSTARPSHRRQSSFRKEPSSAAADDSAIQSDMTVAPGRSARAASRRRSMMV